MSQSDRPAASMPPGGMTQNAPNGASVQPEPLTVNVRVSPALSELRSTSDGETEIRGPLSGGAAAMTTATADSSPAGSLSLTLIATPPAGTPPEGTV